MALSLEEQRLTPFDILQVDRVSFKNAALLVVNENNTFWYVKTPATINTDIQSYLARLHAALSTLQSSSIDVSDKPNYFVQKEIFEAESFLRAAQMILDLQAAKRVNSRATEGSGGDVIVTKTFRSVPSQYDDPQGHTLSLWSREVYNRMYKAKVQWDSLQDQELTLFHALSPYIHIKHKRNEVCVLNTTYVVFLNAHEKEWHVHPTGTDIKLFCSRLQEALDKYQKLIEVLKRNTQEHRCIDNSAEISALSDEIRKGRQHYQVAEDMFNLMADKEVMLEEKFAHLPNKYGRHDSGTLSLCVAADYVHSAHYQPKTAPADDHDNSTANRKSKSNIPTSSPKKFSFEPASLKRPQPVVLVLMPLRDGTYFKTRILSENKDDDTATVETQNGAPKSFQRRKLIFFPTAALEFKIDDFVLVEDKQDPLIFVPGKIVDIIRELGAQPRYNITLHDGKRRKCSAHHIVKISEKQYSRAVERLKDYLRKKEAHLIEALEAQLKRLNASASSDTKQTKDSPSKPELVNRSRGQNTILLRKQEQEPEEEVHVLELQGSQAVEPQNNSSFLQQSAPKLNSSVLMDTMAYRSLNFERVLVLFMPDLLDSERARVFTTAADNGLSLLISKQVRLQIEGAREYFLGREDDPAFAGLVVRLTSGPCFVAVLAGRGALSLCRAILAETSPPLEVAGYPGAFSSVDALHANREIAFFFTPEDPGFMLSSTATVSMSGTLSQSADLSGTRGMYSEFVGQEALCRWVQDGWFYRCTVRAHLFNDVFVIEDQDGVLEPVSVNSFLLLRDRRGGLPASEQKVLCEHPQYAQSFAPGTFKIFLGQKLVQFFDNTTLAVDDSTLCYALPDQSAYEGLVKYIVEGEVELLHRSVVVRSDSDGLFYEGVVTERVGSGHQYNISMRDGTAIAKADDANMLSHDAGYQAEHHFAPGEFAVALYYEGQPQNVYPHNIYGPAAVQAVRSGGMTMDVVFWDSRLRTVARSECYWVSADYYRQACEVIASKRQQQ